MGDRLGWERVYLQKMQSAATGGQRLRFQNAFGGTHPAL
jgi:hypothetical protein